MTDQVGTRRSVVGNLLTTVTVNFQIKNLFVSVSRGFSGSMRVGQTAALVDRLQTKGSPLGRLRGQV